MDILQLAGFNKRTAEEINKTIYRHVYCDVVQERRFKLICRDEVAALIDPESVDPLDRLRYPWVCGFSLSRARSYLTLDSDKMDEIPKLALPYLARVLRGAKFLKNYMDLCAITAKDVPTLMTFLGLDRCASNYSHQSEERFRFNEEEACRLAQKFDTEDMAADSIDNEGTDIPDETDDAPSDDE